MLGSTWFQAGGGNNTSGCVDVVALDLSPLDCLPEAPPPPQGAAPAAEDGDDGAEAAPPEPAELPLEWTYVVDVDSRCSPSPGANECSD